MADTLEDKVDEWGMTDVDNRDANYLQIYDLIEYLAANHFDTYHPTSGPAPSFIDRLEAWIFNLTVDEEQQILFKLIPHLFYIGPEEFLSLYRVAVNGPIERWLIDLDKITIAEIVAGQKIKKSMEATWFCPITDSMDIAAFCHINNISGANLRPDWHSLEKLGAADRIVEYMKKNKLERIVLLEDFVGTGYQMARSLEFAAQLSQDIEVLAVPLVICPKGVERGRKIANKYHNLSFFPVLELKESAFVTFDDQPDDNNFIKRLRELIRRCYPLLVPHDPTGSDDKNEPYGPFGYKSTGGLVILHTNCPNNTLPIIHYKANEWEPLFLRSARYAKR